ncbi:MAG TPA: 16S rRNA (cytidine(1402)-2'-O)-methyltransferase [Woeseiaceae bacterium]
MSGTLFVVATPIGNLEDLTPRARQTLAEVDLIAAEDTRHTGRLLSHLGLKARLMALHEHNEEQVVARLVADLLAGSKIALVSDAGTPLVSDPGFRLVRAAHDAGVTVIPVPGPCAVTAALSVAGLPTDRFCFEGFLPAKQAARRGKLAALVSEVRTIVFYESVHRIDVMMDDLCAAFGVAREAFIGRELTKLHEQCIRATLGELRQALRDGAITGKGEFVVVVAGNPGAADVAYDVDRLLFELARHLPAGEAARITAELTGGKKNVLYQRILASRKDE